MKPYPFPFRIGTTSYILPDDLIPNIQYLGSQVDDVELVLFDLDQGPSNLPAEPDIQILKSLGLTHNLSYTIHLPLDLKMNQSSEAPDVSLVKARKVIEITLPLNPRAFVVHLDGREVQFCQDKSRLFQWQQQARQALKRVAVWAGGLERLAVENLEGYSPVFWEFLEDLPVGRCVDIGHLWLDGHDPILFLNRVYPQVLVIHLHGTATRDHQSLDLCDSGALSRVLRYLKTQDYRGILTVEVFSQAEWLSSLQVLLNLWQKL